MPRARQPWDRIPEYPDRTTESDQTMRQASGRRSRLSRRSVAVISAGAVAAAGILTAPLWIKHEDGKPTVAVSPTPEKPSPSAGERHCGDTDGGVQQLEVKGSAFFLKVLTDCVEEEPILRSAPSLTAPAVSKTPLSEGTLFRADCQADGDSIFTQTQVDIPVWVAGAVASTNQVGFLNAAQLGAANVEQLPVCQTAETNDPTAPIMRD